MRVSEARALHLPDVTADGLLIRATKFQKSRLLPLHATTRAALEQYLARRRHVAGLATHLFVTRRGGPLSRTVITQTFHQVLTAAGIPQVPGARRPRLIDLRHTFAVRALGGESRDARCHRAPYARPDHVYGAHLRRQYLLVSRKYAHS